MTHTDPLLLVAKLLELLHEAGNHLQAKGKKKKQKRKCQNYDWILRSVRVHDGN